jgi:Rad3-related DNA helicase
VSRICSSPRKYVVVAAPTGSGKSLISAAAFAVMGERGIVTTATRALQAQIGRDFPSAILLRGKSNHPCVHPDSARWGKPTVADAPCRDGMECSLRDEGCNYFDDLRRAKIHDFVATNYQMLALTEGLEPDMVCLDEAHDAEDELRRAVSKSIRRGQIADFCLGAPPPEGSSRAVWFQWIKERRDPIEDLLLKYRKQGASGDKWSREMSAAALDTLSGGTMAESADCVVHDTVDNGVKSVNFVPLDLYRHVHLLTKGARRVILLSATITPAALRGLIPPGEEVDFVEVPCTFPVENRRVVILDAPMVKYNMSQTDWGRWMDVLRETVSIHVEAKLNGIVHAGSYDRAAKIAEALRFVGPGLVLHSQWRGGGISNLADAVAEFRKRGAQGGAVLVSPSAHTGYDFPDDECRFQIIPKIMFPDSRDPVTKALQDRDSEWGLARAATKMMQAAGRGVRSETDWCRTYVIDGNAGWFTGKAGKFMPGWFREGLSRMEKVTRPYVPGTR